MTWGSNDDNSRAPAPAAAPKESAAAPALPSRRPPDAPATQGAPPVEPGLATGAYLLSLDTREWPVEDRRLLDKLTSAARKEYPMATGLMDYFPDALAEVSHVSWLGNQKHNPGQPLHWSRGKSADHDDCIMRHMATRAAHDGNVLHLAEVAWRALASLQIALEKEYDLAIPAGAVPPR
jgi:Domain of unknown function (DUF5664)